MIPTFAYAMGIVLAIAIPLGSTRWGVLFIVSVVFDDFRFHEISAANIFLVAFLSSLFLEYLSGKEVRLPLTFVPIVAFLLSAGVSAILAPHAAGRIPSMLSLAALAAMSISLSVVSRDPRCLQSLLSAVLWMSGLLAVSVLGEFALWVFFGIHFKDTVYYLINLQRYVFQASGFFSSNALAAFHLIPGTAIGSTLRSQMGPGAARRRMNWYLMLNIAAIATTIARAALVTLVALAFFLLLRRAWRPGWGRLGALIVVAVLIAVAPHFLGFIAHFNLNSYVARYAIVLGSIDSVSQHGIFGGGPGSLVVPRYPPWTADVVPYIQIDDDDGRETHNTLLEVLVDFGVVGLSWVLIINAIVLWAVSIAQNRFRDSSMSMALQATAVGLFVTEFFALFDSVLYTKPVWIMLGLAAGAVGMKATHASVFVSRSAFLSPSGVAISEVSS